MYEYAYIHTCFYKYINKYFQLQTACVFQPKNYQVFIDFWPFQIYVFIYNILFVTNCFLKCTCKKIWNCKLMVIFKVILGWYSYFQRRTWNTFSGIFKSKIHYMYIYTLMTIIIYYKKYNFGKGSATGSPRATCGPRVNFLRSVNGLPNLHTYITLCTQAYIDIFNYFKNK